MPERSTIAQAVQIGTETTQGTAVAATKRLLALSLGLSVADDVTRFKPRGAKYPTIVYQGKEWTDIDVSGTATYSEMQYPLSSVLTTPTIAQIMDGATPTTAYRWTWNPATFGADTPKTFTVEQGDAVRAHRAANCIITGFTLEGNRSEVSIDGEGYGQAIEDGITLTSSGVTSIDTVPIQPTHVDVYLNNTSGTIGTTKLARVLSWTWGVTDRYSSLFVVDSANPSFVAHVESDPSSEFEIQVEADAAGMALLNTYRTSGTVFMRLRATGPRIYTGAGAPQHQYYQFTVDVAGKVSGVSDFDDEDGVYAVTFTFDSVHDATWGKAMTVELINKQTAL